MMVFAMPYQALAGSLSRTEDGGVLFLLRGVAFQQSVRAAVHVEYLGGREHVRHRDHTRSKGPA